MSGPAIEKVVRLAYHMFSSGFARDGSRKVCDGKPFSDSVLSALQTTFSRLTADDVRLHQSLACAAEKKEKVSYIEIYENPVISVGVFVLHPGGSIPLHDHPNMYGLLKVIHGQLCIQSFNIASSFVSPTTGETIYKARLTSSKSHSTFTEPALLTPGENNIHALSYESGENGNDYAAFVDILSPPYYTGESYSECFYYRSLNTFTETSNDGATVTYHNLRKTLVPPREFATNCVQYCGHSLLNLQL